MASKPLVQVTKTRETSGPRRRAATTRDLILRAAATLFRERGYEGTKIDDIGSAVGLTGPAIYRHFPSKEQLLVAVLEREYDVFEERIEAEVIDTQLSPVAALERYVRLAVATVLEDRGVVSAIPAHVRLLPPDVQQGLTDRHHRIMQKWAKLLRAVRPELSAREAHVVTIVVSSMITAVGLRDIQLRPDRLERMAMAAFLCG